MLIVLQFLSGKQEEKEESKYLPNLIIYTILLSLNGVNIIGNVLVCEESCTPVPPLCSWMQLDKE